MTDLAKCLAEMFEADRDDPDWCDRFPMYRLNVQLGVKPWWPPLSQVWLHQGQCPEPPDGSAGLDPACWADAWALLQRFHGEYLESKRQKAKR